MYKPMINIEWLERTASCLTGNYHLNYYYCSMVSKALRYTGSKAFDAHEVLPGVFVGDVFAAHNADELKKRNITHVLNAVLGVTPPYPEQFKYMHIKLLDYPGENIMPHLQEATKFIEEALAGGGKILIHCLKGVSRSASIAAAFAIYSQKLTTKEAIELLKRSRTIIRPNHGFVMQLQKYEKGLLEEASKQVSPVVGA